MQALNVAYAVLCDQQRREHYDRTGGDIPLNGEEHEARSVLLGIFAQMLEQAPEDFDPIGNLRHAVQQNIDAQAKKLTQIQEKTRKGRAWIDRISSDGEGNIFADLIAEREQQHARQEAQVKRHIEILKTSLDMLAAYRFRVDEQVVFMCTSSGSW